MSVAYVIPPLLGGAGLYVAYRLFGMIMERPGGEGRVAEIAEQIQFGAMVFLKREYTTLGIFSAVVLVLLTIYLGLGTAFAFLLGALSSSAAGYIGMYAATRANVRTALAAHREGGCLCFNRGFFWRFGDGSHRGFHGSFGPGFSLSLFRRRSGDGPCDPRIWSRRLLGGFILPCRRGNLYQKR